MKQLIISNSLAEQTRMILREDIVRLRLKPGSRLTVEALAERFGVSRTPVRDALNALAEEGLVVIVPRVGYYVVELSADDIKEISGIRKMVELYAFQFAIRNITTKRIETLLQETREVKSLPRAERRRVFEVMDREFHLELISAASNERLVDFFMPIATFVDLMRNLNVRVDDALEEHLVILEAMCAGDMVRARTALEKHLDIVEGAILQSEAVTDR